MNKIQQAFDDIHASDELKSKTLKKCVSASKVKFMPQLIAACITLILLLGGTGTFHAVTTEAAYVSIDINPSIGLSLNCFKRVICVDAYNDEAVKILAALSLKGKKYSSAVDDILKTETLHGYDVSTAEIYIESSSDKTNQEISNVIQQKCPNAGMSCHNAQNKEKAKEYNISPGKYYLIEKILVFGGSIDDYKDMSMRELKEIYSNYSGEEFSGGQQRHKGNGQGMHNGHNNKHGQHNK